MRLSVKLNFHLKKYIFPHLLMEEPKNVIKRLLLVWTSKGEDVNKKSVVDFKPRLIWRSGIGLGQNRDPTNTPRVTLRSIFKFLENSGTWNIDVTHFPCASEVQT